VAAPAGGLGDSAGEGVADAPPPLIDGAGDAAGGDAVELVGVGGGVIGTGLLGLGAVVGAIEGIGDGKSEEVGPGALVISGAGSAGEGSCDGGDGSGDGVAIWPPVNKAVPIP